MALPTKEISTGPYEATPVDEIATRYNRVRAGFRTGNTKDIQFRLKQVRKFYWAVQDLEPLIEQALYKDLRKSRHEAQMAEISWLKNECVNILSNLEKWAKDDSIPGLPLLFWPMKQRTRTEPLGTVLVIGSFNYPIQLSLMPFLGALAAGNTVIVKPSENSPHSAMVIKKILDRMDPNYYTCVNGALPASQALLDLKFDKIVFTGGKTVGRIIAQKAAETLTPTLLELGGLNPAFVTKSANVELAARRLLWGKAHNAGQVCLSQNYALVERSVVDRFIAELHKQYKGFMPRGARDSPDYSRIVNKANYDRIKSMVDETKGQIVLGGAMYEDDLIIEPTIVLTENIEDSMITRESFGPVWSIVPYDSLDQAINIANKVDPTPLTLFAFGTDAETEKIVNSVTSGGATINDSYTHSSVFCAPMGGVGQSGNGAYHGYYSYKAFSHERGMAKVPGWADGLLRVRYMPYLPSELSRFQSMQGGKKVNFDRNGDVVRGFGHWVKVILRLGGSGAKSAVVRWVLLLVVTAASLGLRSRTSRL